MKHIDKFLNSITMYKLVSFGLTIEFLIAVVLGFLGLVDYPGIQLIISAIFLVATCYVSNEIFCRIFKAPTNSESYLITGLILFFIITPAANFAELVPVFMAGVLAMASKYAFAIGKKHIFNPAAISAAILGATGSGIVSWWVGTPILFPITLVLGLLIVRKIRRFRMLFAFLITAFASVYYFSYGLAANPLDLAIEMLTSWPVIFFATVMFTEPATTPYTQPLRIAYGVLIGILFGIPFQIGTIYSSPEVFLVLGNIFSYIVNPKEKLMLKLKEKIKLSPSIYDFVFESDHKIKFEAGQYLEWTLPHPATDGRGNRRYFTIASSPTENEIILGTRVSQNGSSFKKHLVETDLGCAMTATQLAGDFTLPKDKNKKLVFIAGGIGITPFRSMIKYLIDKGEERNIVLYYASTLPEDFVYKDIFDNAQGLKTVYIVGDAKKAPNWTGKTGFITEQMIKEETPDYRDRKFYLSGPQVMVDNYKSLLSKLGVHKHDIITDYFPGF